jgi:uncharacterized protein YdeI (BOF family)
MNSLRLLPVALLLFASCEKPPAQPASAAQVASGSLDGKRVQLRGTIGLPEEIQSVDEGMHFALKDSSGIVICNINPGTGRDEMEKLHNNYQASDLKITTHAGASAKNEDRVLLTGEVGKEHDGSYTVTVDEVELAGR